MRKAAVLTAVPKSIRPIDVRPISQSPSFTSGAPSWPVPYTEEAPQLVNTPNPGHQVQQLRSDFAAASATGLQANTLCRAQYHRLAADAALGVRTNHENDILGKSSIVYIINH